MAQPKSQSGRRKTSEVRAARAPRDAPARPASRKADAQPASAPTQARTSREAFEKTLTALANRASAGTRAKAGALLVRCTDSGDEYIVEAGPGAARVTRGGAARGAPTTIRVAGPAAVLAAIVGGRQDAAAAFIRGGLQVSGDLDHLESLLKDLGLLTCP